MTSLLGGTSLENRGRRIHPNETNTRKDKMSGIVNIAFEHEHLT